jgi:hypothetical protein
VDRRCGRHDLGGFLQTRESARKIAAGGQQLADLEQDLPVVRVRALSFEVFPLGSRLIARFPEQYPQQQMSVGNAPSRGLSKRAGRLLAATSLR